jgi:predicted nucleic acid-binding protein
MTVALRLVLDSMIWVQAACAPSQGRRGPSAEIVRLAIDHQLEVLASPYIRAEVLGVLREEPYFRRRLAPGFDAELWLDTTLAACAELVDVTGPPVVQAHAKDDPILWLAVAGGASHLVTWEERLLDLKEHRFTRIMTPRDFLTAWRRPAAHEPLPEWQALRRGPALRRRQVDRGRPGVSARAGAPA